MICFATLKFFQLEHHSFSCVSNRPLELLTRGNAKTVTYILTDISKYVHTSGQTDVKLEIDLDDHTCSVFIFLCNWLIL